MDDLTTHINPSQTLDVTGLSCPMPVIKTKQAIDDVGPGDILEVIATDAGSMSDIKGWASATDGVELLDQVEDKADGNTVYKHYVEKHA